MLRQVRAVDGAAVRARDRDAEPGAAGDDGRGGAAPIASASSRRCRPGTDFTPLMTCYLTDGDRSRRDRARLSRRASSRRSSSTRRTRRRNSAHGVTDIDRVMPVLERMAAIGMPLLIHGEVTDPEVDIFDREAVFIERVLDPLRRRLPELRIVLEHVTTAEAVAYVAAGGPEPRARRSRRIISSSTATRSSPAASGRISTACRSPSARSTAARCAAPRPRATRASFSAPTARRTRSRPRRPPAAAPASSPRRRRSSSTPRCSRRKARSTGSRPSRR